MGALEEERVLWAAPRGFPTAQQEDAGSGRLLGKADQCGPSIGLERNPKPGLPPRCPKEEQQQGEGHFISMDTSRPQRMAEMGQPVSQLWEGSGAGGAGGTLVPHGGDPPAP